MADHRNPFWDSADGTICHDLLQLPVPCPILVLSIASEPLVVNASFSSSFHPAQVLPSCALVRGGMRSLVGPRLWADGSLSQAAFHLISLGVSLS